MMAEMRENSVNTENIKAHQEVIEQLLVQLKHEFNKDPAETSKCVKLIDEIKVKLAGFNFLSNMRSSKEIFMLSREAFEIGVFVSILLGDLQYFSSCISILKLYYMDKQPDVPDSKYEYEIIGLNLLYLLASQKLSDFHTEIETIPIKDVLTNVFLKHPVSLEQYLMEGNYNKIYVSKSNVPSPYYTYFIDLLLTSLRDEIAVCMEMSFDHLNIFDVKKMLHFESDYDLNRFIEQIDIICSGIDMASLGLLCRGILDALRYLKYPTEIEDLTRLELLDFCSLVSSLSTDLKSYLNLEESVGRIEKISEIDCFYLELRGFLKEIGYPYLDMNNVSLKEALSTVEARLSLLDYLCGELLAAKISAFKNSKTADSTPKTVKTSHESDEVKYLKMILDSLGFPEPPPNVTVSMVFTKIEAKLKELLSRLPKDHLSRPLLKCSLNDEQWRKLKYINDVFFEDYRNRKEMWLKRLDVTIQSMLWSERTKKFEKQVLEEFLKRRKFLDSKPSVELADILAARESLCVDQKTCSTRLLSKTKSKLHKLMIGPVPDRGGKVTDYQPVETETFESQQLAKKMQEQRGAYRNTPQGGRGNNQPRYNPRAEYTGRANDQHKGYNDESSKTHYTRGGSGRVQGNWAYNDKDHYETEYNISSKFQDFEVQPSRKYSRGGSRNRGHYNRY